MEASKFSADDKYSDTASLLRTDAVEHVKFEGCLFASTTTGINTRKRQRCFATAAVMTQCFVLERERGAPMLWIHYVIIQVACLSLSCVCVCVSVDLPPEKKIEKNNINNMQNIGAKVL